VWLNIIYCDSTEYGPKAPKHVVSEIVKNTSIKTLSCDCSCMFNEAIYGYKSYIIEIVQATGKYCCLGTTAFPTNQSGTFNFPFPILQFLKPVVRDDRVLHQKSSNYWMFSLLCGGRIYRHTELRTVGHLLADALVWIVPYTKILQVK
jgi:hypothetical protein